MKKRFYQFVALFIFASLLVFQAPKQIFAADIAETSIETKIQIETSLEDRLRKVLTEIAGTEKIIIIINTEMYSEKEKKELQIKTVDERPKMVLPGVPVKENIGERKIEDLLAPLDIGKTKTAIKKISATIIVDKAVSASVIEIMKKVAFGLLGIDETRGDQLIIERMNFKQNPFYWYSLLYPPNLYWVIIIALATFFVFGSVLFLFNPFKIFSKSLVEVIAGLVAAQKEANTSSQDFGAQNQQSTSVETASAQTASLSHDSENRKPFWFIVPQEINQLRESIKTESSENIAVILNYIDRDMASKLFADLNADQKMKVSELFSNVKQMDPDAVKSLEQKVRDTLNYSLGGDEILVKLLDYSDKATQDKIIANFKAKNPPLAAKLMKSVFSFEDIVNFSGETLQTVMRRINLSAFAQILKTMPEQYTAKIMEALTEAGRKRLQQEMELGKPLSAQRIIEEKRRVIESIRKLNAEGIIELI